MEMRRIQAPGARRTPPVANLRAMLGSLPQFSGLVGSLIKARPGGLRPHRQAGHGPTPGPQLSPGVVGP